ncbi:hypothetical protein Sjap_015078 [Stephania japonica]|uniref:Uncharacterized protein n=1 Tax=Stephania japonica TaxID=461633 RepID=A0AAP0IK21_9MAGN
MGRQMKEIGGTSSRIGSRCWLRNFEVVQFEIQNELGMVLKILRLSGNKNQMDLISKMSGGRQWDSLLEALKGLMEIEKRIQKGQRRLNEFLPKEITVPNKEGGPMKLTIAKVHVDKQGVDSTNLQELLGLLRPGVDVVKGEGIEINSRQASMIQREEDSVKASLSRVVEDTSRKVVAVVESLAGPIGGTTAPGIYDEPNNIMSGHGTTIRSRNEKESLPHSVVGGPYSIPLGIILEETQTHSTSSEHLLLKQGQQVSSMACNREDVNVQPIHEEVDHVIGPERPLETIFEEGEIQRSLNLEPSKHPGPSVSIHYSNNIEAQPNECSLGRVENIVEEGVIGEVNHNSDLEVIFIAFIFVQREALGLSPFGMDSMLANDNPIAMVQPLQSSDEEPSMLRLCFDPTG